MSTLQPTYDGCLPNFFLPRSEAAQRVDAFCEVLNSPEFLADDIASAEEKIREKTNAILNNQEQILSLDRENIELRDDIVRHGNELPELRRKLAAMTGGAK